jgi:hypothetical protein
MEYYTKRRIFYSLCVLIAIIGGKIPAQETIFNNEQLKAQIRQGVEYTYNFDFAKAEEVYKMLARERPGHPAGPAYYSMMLYLKYFPLTEKSEKADVFVDSLLKSISFCEKILKKDETNVDGIFFDLLARLMLMEYYADNDLSKKVISQISPAYKMMRMGFLLKDQFSDFYYSTGLYNYYREEYPEAYPRFKAIAIFFPKGDKKIGLEQLEYAGENSIFLGAESMSYLYYIYMYYERKYSAALDYAKILNKKFPNNPIYVSARIQLLLLLKKYDDAGPFLIKLAESAKRNLYFEMLYYIYSGIIEEKKYKNYELSEKLYSKAIYISSDYATLTSEQLSFAYFGLSRLYAIKGDAKQSKEFRKTANSLSSFRNINFD